MSAVLNSLGLKDAAMKSEAEILSQSFCIPAEPGVYFLIKDGQIVYVGKSMIPIRRIGDHARDKIFDSISFIPCCADELDSLEQDYIRALKPTYNLSRPKFNITAAALPSAALARSAKMVKPVSA